MLSMQKVSFTAPICVQPLGVIVSECFFSWFISLLLSLEYNNLSKVSVLSGWGNVKIKPLFWSCTCSIKTSKKTLLFWQIVLQIHISKSSDRSKLRNAKKKTQHNDRIQQEKPYDMLPPSPAGSKNCSVYDTASHSLSPGSSDKRSLHVS